ncbi:serine hydrolase [Amycolatopsis tucumanensis]|uniref:Beta-lactamase class A catalytic domain-containing protein n=1 Tax=Amycolatopsis tucumanensis TaxID=401106 RepID=A0ABP7JCB7_9PSEU|nr:serine hydrolase [Amycolatopsis tucumanensis]MCF6427106.1 class A beta-lactamase-related serine hydrolase [Amycolatopsis tucumanensis]
MSVQTRPLRRGPIVVLVVAVVVIALALGAALALRGSAAEPVPADSAATSVVVYDRKQNRPLRQEGADTRYRSASLVKLLIAVDLVQRGHVTPDRPSPRVTRMLSYSDDAIANQLWESGGGPDIVRRTATSLGLTATEPPTDPGRWGDTLLSADDVVKIYRAVLAMPSRERQLILDPLRDAHQVAADGVDQYFGIPDALPGRPWAIKQGWAAGRGGVDAHTSGVVGTGDRYVVVVLSHRPGGTALETAMREVTETTATIEDLLN